LVAVKAVAFSYEPDEAVRFKLIKAVYEEFKRYGLHSHYTLSACEAACVILKNSKRNHRTPVAKRLFLKLDNQTYRVEDEAVRIPLKPDCSLNFSALTSK
jgi:hypothetical protein